MNAIQIRSKIYLFAIFLLISISFVSAQAKEAPTVDVLLGKADITKLITSFPEKHLKNTKYNKFKVSAFRDVKVGARSADFTFTGNYRKFENVPTVKMVRKEKKVFGKRIVYDEPQVVSEIKQVLSVTEDITARLIVRETKGNIQLLFEIVDIGTKLPGDIKKLLIEQLNGHFSQKIASYPSTHPSFGANLKMLIHDAPEKATSITASTETMNRIMGNQIRQSEEALNKLGVFLEKGRLRIEDGATLLEKDEFSADGVSLSFPKISFPDIDHINLRFQVKANKITYKGNELSDSKFNVEIPLKITREEGKLKLEMVSQFLEPSFISGDKEVDALIADEANIRMGPKIKQALAEMLFDYEDFAIPFKVDSVGFQLVPTQFSTDKESATIVFELAKK